MGTLIRRGVLDKGDIRAYRIRLCESKKRI